MRLDLSKNYDSMLNCQSTVLKHLTQLLCIIICMCVCKHISNYWIQGKYHQSYNAWTYINFTIQMTYHTTVP